MPNPSELQRIALEGDEQARETAIDELRRRAVEANVGSEIDLLGGKPDPVVGIDENSEIDIEVDDRSGKAWFHPDDEAKSLDQQIHDELDNLGRLLREANECAGRIEKLSQEIVRGR